MYYPSHSFCKKYFICKKTAKLNRLHGLTIISDKELKYHLIMIGKLILMSLILTNAYELGNFKTFLLDFLVIKQESVWLLFLITTKQMKFSMCNLVAKTLIQFL